MFSVCELWRQSRQTILLAAPTQAAHTIVTPECRLTSWRRLAPASVDCSEYGKEEFSHSNHATDGINCGVNHAPAIAGSLTFRVGWRLSCLTWINQRQSGPIGRSCDHMRPLVMCTHCRSLCGSGMADD